MRSKPPVNAAHTQQPISSATPSTVQDNCSKDLSHQMNAGAPLNHTGECVRSISILITTTLQRTRAHRNQQYSQHPMDSLQGCQRRHQPADYQHRLCTTGLRRRSCGVRHRTRAQGKCRSRHRSLLTGLFC